MSKEEHTALVTAAVTMLEEAARLLISAEEGLLADQVEELAYLVEVVATPGEDAETAAAA